MLECLFKNKLCLLFFFLYAKTISMLPKKKLPKYLPRLSNQIKFPFEKHDYSILMLISVLVCFLICFKNKVNVSAGID